MYEENKKEKELKAPIQRLIHKPQGLPVVAFKEIVLNYQ